MLSLRPTIAAAELGRFAPDDEAAIRLKILKRAFHRKEARKVSFQASQNFLL